MNKAVVV